MSRNQAPSRTDNEWFEVITECRNSGLSDSAWCQAHSIPVGTFYCAVNRLRKKAFALPERNSISNIALDLTTKQDVVRIDIEEPLTPSVPQPVRQTTYLDNSHTIEIDIHGIGIRISNGADPSLLSMVLSSLGGQSC